MFVTPFFFPFQFMSLKWYLPIPFTPSFIHKVICMIFLYVFCSNISILSYTKDFKIEQNKKSYVNFIFLNSAKMLAFSQLEKKY